MRLLSIYNLFGIRPKISQKGFDNPIVWKDDLSDDCTALWCGLMLRAEWMDEDYWFWAVYDMDKNEFIVDATYERSGDEMWLSGEAARAEAEKVARNYIKQFIKNK